MAHNDGQGSMAELVAMLAQELANPPLGPAERTMAWVIDATGQGDHLGLLIGSQPSPGGFDLLASAIQARTRLSASLLLEWTLAEGQRTRRCYCGWTIQQLAGTLTWHRLPADALRLLVAPGRSQALGADPIAIFID